MPEFELADVTFSSGNPAKVCTLGLSPTTSTTVIGDILVPLLMIAIGFTRDDYAKRHHGGNLDQNRGRNPTLDYHIFFIIFNFCHLKMKMITEWACI